jgi:cell division protein FtsI/penicillin-binding protein 2
LDIGNRPHNDGAEKKSAAPHKKEFKVPEKGRIRFVLCLVLLVIIVRYTGPCVCDCGNEKELLPDGSAVSTDTASVLSGDTRTNQKKTARVRGDRASQRRFVRGNDGRGDRSRSSTAPAPDYMMTFDDVRWLVNEYNVPANAAEQQVIITADDTRRRRRGGRDTEDDTLSLYLSIDTSIQAYATRLLRRYKPRYGAVAAIDPSTGRVLALASFAGEGEPIDGSDLYLKSIFPAASVFKTVVAAAGIERGGMNRNSKIKHFGRSTTLYRSQLVENLKVSQDISLQDAYAYSNNPAFGRIALFNVNKNIISDYGRRFGFLDTIPFEFDVDVSAMLNPDSGFSIAEFASGFNRETMLSPILGALLAGAICENGAINAPTVIDSIRSSKRDTLVYNRTANVWRRAVKESTAAELRWLMTKVTHYGTARTTFRPVRESQRYRHYEFGGKTGNVNQRGLGRVDWFVGFARNPNNKNQRIAVGVVTTHGEFWTVKSNYIAAELFKKYINDEVRRARAAEP